MATIDASLHLFENSTTVINNFTLSGKNATVIIQQLTQATRVFSQSMNASSGVVNSLIDSLKGIGDTLGRMEAMMTKDSTSLRTMTASMSKMASSSVTASNILKRVESNTNKLCNASKKESKMLKAIGKDTNDTTSKYKLAGKAMDLLGKVFDLTKTKAQLTGSSIKNIGKSSAETRKNISPLLSSLGQMIKKFAGLDSIKAGMGITDNFMLGTQKIKGMCGGLEEANKLQTQIMNSANRSRTSYDESLSSVLQFANTAKGAFKNNDEIVGFTELLQKSAKLSGADASTQSDIMSQMGTAMASGQMDSGGLTQVMQNAPVIAEQIASYMGVAEDELKKLADQGLITSDVIKNAMFSASGEIDGKFAELPMTFTDIWTMIKNWGIGAFQGIMVKINELLNQSCVRKFLEGVFIAVNLIGQVAENVLNLLISNLPIICTILGVIGTVLLAQMIYGLWSMIPALITQAAAWMAANVPILFIAAVIGVIITLVVMMGGTFETVCGYVIGTVYKLKAILQNVFFHLYNMIAMLINNGYNMIKNTITNIKIKFLECFTNILQFAKNMIDKLSNVLEVVGISINTDGFDALIQQKKDEMNALESDLGWKTVMEVKEYVDVEEAYTTGSEKGEQMGASLSKGLNKMIDQIKIDGKESGINSRLGTFDYEDFGTTSNPVNVQGEVEISDEDTNYLRDLAEREYINRFSTATLAPNVSISFGDVHETVNAYKLAGIIDQIMKEEIATMAEG